MRVILNIFIILIFVCFLLLALNCTDMLDKYQNGEMPMTCEPAIDMQAPVGTLVINNDDYYTRDALVTLNLNVTDTSELYCTFSNNGLDWSEPEPYASAMEWYLTTGADNEEEKTVYGRIYDSAGNVTEMSDSIYHLEYLTPSIYFVIDTTGSMGINNRIMSVRNQLIEHTEELTSGDYILGMCEFSGLYESNEPSYINEILNLVPGWSQDQFDLNIPTTASGIASIHQALKNMLNYSLISIDNDAFDALRPKVIILVTDCEPVNETFTDIANTIGQSCSSGIPVILYGIDNSGNTNKNLIAQAGQQGAIDPAYYTDWTSLFDYLLPKIGQWAVEGEGATWCCNE